MRRQRHPSLTPLRAFRLLRMLEAAGEKPAAYVLSEVREALAEHVMAALTRSRRRTF